jgi:hypothetical protein
MVQYIKIMVRGWLVMERGVFILIICFFSCLSIPLSAQKYVVEPNRCFPADGFRCRGQGDRIILTKCNDGFEAKTFDKFTEALNFLKEKCGEKYSKVACMCIESKGSMEVDAARLQAVDVSRSFNRFETEVICEPSLRTGEGMPYFLGDDGEKPAFTPPLSGTYYFYYCDKVSGRVDTTKKMRTPPSPIGTGGTGAPR